MSAGSGQGKVWLVGAGPGDPGLITVAGLEAVRRADVIVYDRLVSPRLLDHAREGAELVYVGKTPSATRVGQGPSPDREGSDSHDQSAINGLLIERAREGKMVVRLKGGDPFVFGRGGEEGEALRAAGVPFEVVPGVTSATAVPAYAGIPVTHRGLASSFAVVTGHEADLVGHGPSRDTTAIDWQRLATAVDTLVLLMGVKTLPDIVEKLTAAGRPPGTPVAVIQQGTTPDQRTVTGTLADIVQRVREAGLKPPAITIVGEVARLRDTLSWFESRPLFGKRVLITRTRRQASVLARLLADEGAVPIELPAIEIEARFDTKRMASLMAAMVAGDYDWLVFTSANAVEIFMGAVWSLGLDARAVRVPGVAAIGPETVKTLATWGLGANLVPERYVSEGLIEAFRDRVEMEGARVLVPRAESARPELVEGLRGLGAEVDEVTLYRSAVPEDAPAEALSLLRDGGIDIVTFTSSSTVRNLAALLGGDVECLRADARPSGRRPLIACIGPITADTARELGLRVDIVAEEHTVPGLVRAVNAHYARGNYQ